MMKMIIIILLFITLTCSVCETFEVDSSQNFYQFFKNEDVTLEWISTNSSLDSFHIYCFMITDHENVSVLLEYDEGLEFPLDGPFEGRVQFDKDALSEGTIRLHVSSLRIEDSGYWNCEVNKSEGFEWEPFHIIVTEPQTTPENGNTWSGVRIGLVFGLSALVLCVCGFLCICSYKSQHNSSADTRGNSVDRNTNAAGHRDICLNQVDGTRQI